MVTLASQILALITKEQLTNSQLYARFTNRNQHTVRRAIGDLARTGQIERVSEGRYNPKWKVKGAATVDAEASNQSEHNKPVAFKQNPRPEFQGVKSAPPVARAQGSNFFTF